MKNSHGQGVNDVLVNIVKEFPKHDFETEDGIRQAVQEIAEQLNEVGTYEEDHGQYRLSNKRKR
jgi:hypothetical protein